MARTTAPPGLIAFVFAWAATLFMLSGGRDFCLDDAWIHLAYAKSLRLGDGFSYNPGDHATGFSSPLWVALLAVAPWSEAIAPVLPVKLLGALCHAATAWGAASLTGAVLGEAGTPAPYPKAALAGVMCACDPALVFAAVSGMEVSLTAALLVWTAWAVLAERRQLSAALAACAVWARPESLLFLAPWSLLRIQAKRSRAALWTFGAACGALLVWMLYCKAVSGYPFPNTYYAKRDARLGEGLLFFVLEYLPQHAWVAGLTGIALLISALARTGEPRRLLLAWLTAVAAIAATRMLLPRTQFYGWRYFAVLGAIPWAALASAPLAGLEQRRWLTAALFTPIALATTWNLASARVLQRAQEHDIALVHSEPADWLARNLPNDARVLVEGAGATRFALARGARVIDELGLNSNAIVHAAEGRDRLCAVLHFAPTHVLLPDDSFAAFSRPLELEVLREFVDPDYRILATPRVRRVTAARVVRVLPVVRRLCGLP